MDWLNQVIEQVGLDGITRQVVRTVGPIILILIGAGLTILGRLIWRQLLVINCFMHSRSRALNAVKRIKSKDGLQEGKGIWLQPTSKPENYEESFVSRVLVVANNKGGVAKTTLCANLAAYWAKEWKKRVLIIDVDYQGSVSSMALRTIKDWISKRCDSLATRAISGDLKPNILVQCAKEVPGEPRLKVIPAYYDLAQADNRLMIEWLLGCARRRSKTIFRSMADLLVGKLFVRQDVRYNLYELLHTKAVQEAFDIVITDCPPRVSTGVIQALCAARHVLIPTILDLPSAEATVSFCNELQELKKQGICPKLNYAGIVGTMVSANVDQIAERAALEKIRDGLRDIHFPSGLLAEEHFMRKYTAFVKDAEEGIAYLTMGDAQIREAIGSLAEYVASMVELPKPAHHEMKG